MAGTFSIKLLAEGSLQNSVTTLYTVPAATSTIIKTIVLTNNDSVGRSVNLYIKRTGSSRRRIIPVNMTLGGGFTLETDEEYILNDGDIVEGDCSLIGVVDFTIHGVEET